MVDAKTVYRFLSKISKTDSCWNWTAGLAHHGYGQFRFGQRPWKSHRMSWTIHNGPIPDGLLVLHRCDNRICVNPDHLYLGTTADNTADMMAKNRCARFPMRKGELVPTAKLTKENVAYIRSVYVKRKQPTLATLAKQFGVDPTTIHSVVIGESWIIS